MYLKNKKLLKIFFLVIFIFFPKNIFAQTSQNIYIPCEVEKCKPEWGPTNTRWYKGDGDKKKPAIIWYGGGKGNYTGGDNQPINRLIGKFDIIMVASPFELFSDQRTQGLPSYVNDENLIFRMRQATEHYKKLINKPIWLGGISSGGVRVIATISGKDRFSDNYAGLIFSSTYVARNWQGSPQYLNLESDIKYEMNLPILVFQHARDMKPQQQPYLQEYFTKGLAKKNINKTELALLTEGDTGITTGDGGHHWFMSNKEEVARIVEKFIMENTK
jgi:hypothetical protein